MQSLITKEVLATSSHDTPAYVVYMKVTMKINRRKAFKYQSKVIDTDEVIRD